MAGIGTLIVEVYASNALLPLRGANVYITAADDSRLWGARQSDMEGKTQPVSIEAPDADLSLVPTPDGVDPFTSVNVYVQLDNYYNILVRGVQIFSGQESLQRVRMIPLPENYTGQTTEIITITPQNL